MFDFCARLESLVGEGAVPRVLHGCHSPCRRLVNFEDFCQNVLLQALEHRESFRGHSDAELLGWLRVIGQQKMIDALRTSRRRRLTGLPAEVADPSAGPPLDTLIDQEEQARKLRRLVQLLASLSEEDRDLLVRHYLRAEPLTAIAARMGVAPNTLSQRHVRLLLRLRKMREQ